MSTRLHVRVDAASPPLRGVVAAVATLPATYRLQGARDDGAVPDVVVIDGARTGWGAQAADAAAHGARAVIVVAPSAPAGGPTGGVPLIADDRHAGNPAARTLRDHLQAADRGALLEVRITDGLTATPRAQFAAALALAEAAAGSRAAQASLVVASARTHIARATLDDGRPVHIAMTCTDALPVGATLRIVSTGSVLSARFPDGTSAAPGIVRVSQRSGCTTPPAVYETAHRVALRRAARAARDAGTEDDTTDVLRRIALVDTVFPTVLAV